MNTTRAYRQSGTSLIEVLVTIVILLVGLLGLAGLQGRLQTSEMESYQRSQALILLDDMANRIAANRTNAADYATTAGPIGIGVPCEDMPGTTAAEKDSKEWCIALQGAAETSGSRNLGVMVGGRGCVEDLGSGQYMVTVVWQGMAPISTPPESVACGKDLYNSTATGSTCINDLCRRAITTLVRIAAL